MLLSQAELDFSQYFEVVQHSVGPHCAARLSAATAALETLVATTDGQQKLKSLFNLCTPLQTDDDIALLFESLSDPIAGVVQYSNDNNKYQPFNVSVMCAQLTNETAQPDPLLALVDLVNDIQVFTNSSCVEVNYTAYIAELQPTSAGRSWTWQTCTEFGYYQTGESARQPFSSKISLDWFVQQCADIFGVPGLTPAIDATNAFYGSVDLRTANTFFSNGRVDPWHALGVVHGHHGPGTHHVLMDGTAHCADLYPPRPQDVAQLTDTRKRQVAAMESWLDN